MSQSARSMAARRRRRIDAGLLLGCALVVAVLAFAVAALAGGERIARLWVSATIAEDGSARIVEVIDYDFGTEERRGIYRDVPGLRAEDGVEVSSPDAPADVTVTGEGAVRLRIGDPDVTVSGEHRYRLSYTLGGVSRNGELAWDAVGTGWEVPIDEVEVHVTGPVELDADACVAGDRGSTDGCALRQTAPGHLVARVTDLEPGQGVTVYATEGRALDAAPDAPVPPTAAPSDPGTDPLLLAGLAGLLALLAGALVSRTVRRAGREHVPSAGLPTLVSSGGEARIDFEELGGFAPASPSIPRDLSPAQGGVLLSGSVAERHKAAWLVDLAVRGVVDLEPPADGGKELTLVRLADGDPAAARLLDLAFAGRSRFRMGGYDESFAAAWTAVGAELAGWQRTSGLWDAEADRRVGRVRWLGVLAGLIGLVVIGVGAWLGTGQSGVLPLVLTAAGGALAGGGTSAALRAWELRVLTPAGSSAWLRVESLRRYLAECAPTAVDDALAEGTLGDYSAWALALGEAERWSTLAKSVRVRDGVSYDDRHWRYASYGPVFLTSCSSSSTEPSSSSSGGGGGGGGSVGGGAGGGGGGSW